MHFVQQKKGFNTWQITACLSFFAIVSIPVLVFVKGVIEPDDVDASLSPSAGTGIQGNALVNA
ncbi:hypothetical protein GSI_10227 [Ganoderma sinense ZZ0214-1]|uniref:Uncharacterized protein n=1 Tax=Ganoderma sinense ZZ0214-1 TaxID=1077348 RepID=A0A2G8S014_9APHY|nr:hypothetical protein GSI_10227 [Ganoderma sinense ZZ0214-1]